jgi:hypothetical protein
MSEAGSEENFDPCPFVGHLQTLQKESRRHFQEFSSIEPVIKFVVNHLMQLASQKNKL